MLVDDVDEDEDGSEMACGFIYVVVCCLLFFLILLFPLRGTPLSLPSSILALALSIPLPSIRALQPAYCIYMNITLGSSVPP